MCRVGAQRQVWRIQYTAGGSLRTKSDLLQDTEIVSSFAAIFHHSRYWFSSSCSNPKFLCPLLIYSYMVSKNLLDYGLLKSIPQRFRGSSTLSYWACSSVTLLMKSRSCRVVQLKGGLLNLPRTQYFTGLLKIGVKYRLDIWRDQFRPLFKCCHLATICTTTPRVMLCRSKDSESV